MKMGLFEGRIEQYPLSVVGCKEHQRIAYECASKAITLVKNLEQRLPITPEVYPHIRLYHLKDKEESDFKEAGSKASLKALLEQEGFEVSVYDEEHLDFHEIFEGGIADIKKKCDLAIYLAEFDTASNYTVRRVEWNKLMAANAPWFIHEVPTIFISLANPYHLFDVPMVKTYINCYSNHDATLLALVKKLVGKEPFVGVSPVDAFCGRWDTKR